MALTLTDCNDFRDIHKRQGSIPALRAIRRTLYRLGHEDSLICAKQVLEDCITLQP